jgi:uncharacterized protein YbjT (DUF2867 family)
MKIVVIGGSGLIGRNVVRRLLAQGHDPVPASPATGVDTITGEGLADVVVGAEVVVDVSNAPVWDDDPVMKFFTTSRRGYLEARTARAARRRCRRAGGERSRSGEHAVVGLRVRRAVVGRGRQR